MHTIQSAALIGLGALGILFGRPMQRHDPEHFTVIADAGRIRRYQSEPVTCNGEPCRFSYTLPEEGHPVDLVLVAVKATALDSAIRDIARFVGPDTVIVSVLNGITSEQRLDAVYPGHLLWSVAVGMDATRTGRTLVYQCPGCIQLGERDGSTTPRLQAVADYLTACGIVCQPCGDILFQQWKKLMINVGLNQTSAVYGLSYGGMRGSAAAREKIHQAMQEVIALAHAEGVPLPDDCDVTWLRANMPGFGADGRPSMGQDVLAHRPTEVEEFAGVVCRLGRKHGIPTPGNDFYYRTIKEMEQGWRQETQG